MINLIEGPSTSPARAKAADYQTRLFWALPLANGAGLVALASLVGSLGDPMHAARALSPAFLLFGSGLSFGFTALHHAFHQATVELLMFQAADRHLRGASRIAETIALLQFSKLSPENLRLIMPEEEVKNLSAELFRGLVATQTQALTEEDENAAHADAEVARYRAEAQAAGSQAQRAATASHICCALAIAAALAMPWLNLLIP